jgi:hypothetical protein
MSNGLTIRSRRWPRFCFHWCPRKPSGSRHRSLAQGEYLPDPRQRRRVQRGGEPIRLLSSEHGDRHGDGRLPHRRPDPRAGAGHGRDPVLQKRFKHNGVNGPNMATVYSDRGLGVRAPVVFYNRSQRGRRAAQAGRLRLGGRSSRTASVGFTAAASSPRCPRRRARPSSRA